MSWTVVMLCAETPALVLAVWALLRVSRRLLQFDELFELLVHDLETNVKYFESVQSHPVLSNAEEVVTADRNMRIMRARMEEYVSRMDELTRHRNPRKKGESPPVSA